MTDQTPEKPPLIIACPCCRKSVLYRADNPWRPFCSERCRLIDLGEWASEGHRIAGEPLEPDPDES
ncbi:DNA gyrase inhibitor YacG [Permianibacter sp. IMCC34836]|uniref:DNA gyrase inhibitor YacG n=1 Tax=Permianibacter fluminis TaxID=2738515 RepID=UPI001557D1F9|nr:DNA gyrase inhibitor YacG [Permianibacter fluminis]NQD37025.1 DNA gyrase inhibitor YacG [Permianibacter fluminis]